MTTKFFSKKCRFFIHPTDLFSNGLKAYIILVHLQRDPAIAFEIFRLEIFLWSLVFQWEMKNLPKIWIELSDFLLYIRTLINGTFLPKCIKGRFTKQNRVDANKLVYITEKSGEKRIVRFCVEKFRA